MEYSWFAVLYSFCCTVKWISYLYISTLFYFIYFFNFYIYFILLYNSVLLLPYIDMNQPRVYMSSQSWTPLPPPTREMVYFRMDWLDLLAIQGTLKGLLQHHSSKASSSALSFFTVQLSHPYMTTRKTIALTRRTFVGKVMSLPF